MSGRALEQRLQVLLHPWDPQSEAPAATLDITIHGDSITLTFPDHNAEVGIEVDAGKPRLLVYVPDACDSPVSVRWTGTGLSIDTEDYREEGGALTPP